VDRKLVEDKLDFEEEEKEESKERKINEYRDIAMTFRVKWLLKLGLVRLSKYGIRDLFEYN